MADASVSLADLRGLRTAPELNAAACEVLRNELLLKLNPCEWFTIGVMAPSAAAAVAALRSVETALGWESLELDPAGEALASIEGPVFLKGNQNSGRFLVRRESGLGEGMLITGHSPVDPDAEDTWGPLPLQLFSA
ncbi:MAG: DUF1824 family protein [Cyanobacteria bacterium K_DeepCast_35m_m1_288]|nr:DUF1824 family protein [Cyanobacteria bacterium K_DeepCast_35m_m1_288]